MMHPVDRRTFLALSAAAGGAFALAVPQSPAAEQPVPATALPGERERRFPRTLPDLAPARWIWYPSARCLPNTFVLFRREVVLAARPRRATGWIGADSRYLLTVNGKRIQWGPPPCDPRYLEADPLDLGRALVEGKNVIAATVLFYGHGDGTWPIGKPGFLFHLTIEGDGGGAQTVVSDASWLALLARSWPPGHYKRWYLRALQEEFDARRYPYRWMDPDFAPGPDWLPAMPLDCPPNEPPSCSSYPEYMLEIHGDARTSELRPRSIPLMKEHEIPVTKLCESFRLEWKRPPEEYFECLVPDAFAAARAPVEQPQSGSWAVELDGDPRRAAALTFELDEQVVGWPYFTIEAPEGTIVELLVHEAHEPGGPPLLNTHFHSWTRFTCRDGSNRFEPFDFESLRWLQLHIRNARGRVIVRDVGVRRRIFPWRHEPEIECSEPALNRLFGATINTLNNCAQETLVDGMARERQQYSGDCGHQLHAIYAAFGETDLPARYLATFSQGIALDGYFLDCWPAYDRLARLMERQLGLTGWGPILDHGIGFNFDCYHHYLYTGDLDALREPYPRLLRFAQYLRQIVGPDGLLPVENLGVPSVWIDHVAYREQRHKGCAFNLYAAAMHEHALAPLCRAFGDSKAADEVAGFGRELLRAARKRFWSERDGLFVANLPWLGEEGGGRRLCDRSLATAILFDQCPDGRTEAAVRALETCPPELGFSYPANAGWRLWALGAAGRPDAILKDLRARWATMPSVILNRTVQEDWNAPPDSGAQWSHCAVAPLYVTVMCLAGIRPLEPGFDRVELRPQLGDLAALRVTARTVKGDLRFEARGKLRDRALSIELPPGCAGELVVPSAERLDLEPAAGPAPSGSRRFHLPAGGAASLALRHC